MSHDHSFVPRWQPPFIAKLTPEDRCHLNGVALRDGAPAFATAFSDTDTPEGWREKRLGGGILMDVGTGEIVLEGLCMPHSPRVYRGQGWLLESGKGKLLRFDPKTGDSEEVCALPGYARGLSFAGDCALVGLCRVREKQLGEGIPLQNMFPELVCGCAVVELKTGRTVGMFEFASGCEEMYDVLFLPGVRRANILNLHRDDGHQPVSCPETTWWFCAEKEDDDGGAEDPPKLGEHQAAAPTTELNALRP